MKRFFLLLGIGASFFGVILTSSAAEIQNVQIVPSDETTTIQWEALPLELRDSIQGYAIQWSLYQEEIKNTENRLVKQWIDNPDENAIVLRTGTFNPGEDDTFFLRIYGYTQDGRERALVHGSKIYKFKFNLDKKLEETEILEPNDPVIVDNTSKELGSVFNFGKLITKIYDDHIYLSWSKPRLTSVDARGVLIAVSEKEDMSNPIVELEGSLKDRTGKIEGLTPDTTYYVAGYFYKTVGGEVKKFGRGSTEIIKTFPQMTNAQKARINRLRRAGRITLQADVVASVEGGNITTQTDDDSDNSTNNSSSDDTDTTTSDTDTSSNRSEIIAKIRQLEAELQRLKQQLRELGGPSSNASPVAQQRARASDGRTIKRPLSIRERLQRLFKGN